MDPDPERLQIVDLVNKAFGECGWSFSISSVALDFVDEKPNGVYAAGASVVVRVQRASGVYREELGYGWGSGSHKAEVIAKSKMDAVTNGLKGAVILFGGDISRKLSTVTPRKELNTNPGVSSNHQGNSLSMTPVSSPAQTVGKQNSEGQIMGRLPCAQVMPSTNTSKVSPAPNRIVPVPRAPSPLAVPLCSSTSKSNHESKLSEEEQAKIERKKRQRLLQEEFRKKHLQEQAQALAQAKSQDKNKTVSQGPMNTEHYRVPLKEQQSSNHFSRQTQSSNSHLKTMKGNAAAAAPSSEAADDDVLLSTQDMEAMLQIAANDTTISKRSPMVTSPSIVRPSASEAQPMPAKKRTDLSTFAFNPEKKARGSERR
ncbi:DNA repair and recombination protein RAD52 [Frankliniella fusca]|uniref:DNA repair and recombination protein RAD52 n=1 Tax=Frankliniella fusca TaxID=407009 RepID=A0AAE1HTY3_9NEOP|nr:DNA repair and recombination protein RAD52 [Frankliniella fusca]